MEVPPPGNAACGAGRPTARPGSPRPQLPGRTGGGVGGGRVGQTGPCCICVAAGVAVAPPSRVGGDAAAHGLRTHVCPPPEIPAEDPRERPAPRSVCMLAGPGRTEDRPRARGQPQATLVLPPQEPNSVTRRCPASRLPLGQFPPPALPPAGAGRDPASPPPPSELGDGGTGRSGEVSPD